MKSRSKFEGRVRDALGPSWLYEDVKLPYTLRNNYIPDFVKGKLVVEAKGRFTGADRRKMLAAKTENPEWDIRIVFMRNNPLYKGAATRYLDWAAKHGFRATVFPVLPLNEKEATSYAKRKASKKTVRR